MPVEKEKSKSKFSCINSINFIIEQTSGYVPMININWHNNTLLTLEQIYQPSYVNISYANAF